MHNLTINNATTISNKKLSLVSKNFFSLRIIFSPFFLYEKATLWWRKSNSHLKRLENFGCISLFLVYFLVCSSYLREKFHFTKMLSTLLLMRSGPETNHNDWFSCWLALQGIPARRFISSLTNDDGRICVVRYRNSVQQRKETWSAKHSFETLEWACFALICLIEFSFFALALFWGFDPIHEWYHFGSVGSQRFVCLWE